MDIYQKKGGKLTRHSRLKKHERFKERLLQGPERCCEYLTRKGTVPLNEMECLYITFLLELIVLLQPSQDFKDIYKELCLKTDDIVNLINKTDNCKAKIRAVIQCLCVGRGKRLGERFSVTESDGSSIFASAVGSTMGAMATIGILTINLPAGLISAAAYGTYLENVKNKYQALKLTKRQRTIRFALLYLQLAYKFQDYLETSIDDFDTEKCVSFKGLATYQENQQKIDPNFSITRKLLEKARVLADSVVKLINNEKNIVYQDALQLRNKLNDLLILIRNSRIEKSQLYAVGVFL